MRPEAFVAELESLIRSGRDADALDLASRAGPELLAHLGPHEFFRVTSMLEGAELALSVIDKSEWWHVSSSASERSVPMSAIEVLSRLRPREREIVDLRVKGLTNRAIAQRFGVSERTVGRIIVRVLGQVGAANRTGAERRAALAECVKAAARAS